MVVKYDHNILLWEAAAVSHCNSHHHTAQITPQYLATDCCIFFGSQITNFCILWCISIKYVLTWLYKIFWQISVCYGVTECSTALCWSHVWPQLCVVSQLTVVLVLHLQLWRLSVTGPAASVSVQMRLVGPCVVLLVITLTTLRQMSAVYWLRPVRHHSTTAATVNWTLV